MTTIAFGCVVTPHPCPPPHQSNRWRPSRRRAHGDPFVDVGDSVVQGQVLCIVEAMKLMNEIEAEAAGTIVEVLVENGKPVEYGDRLFRIEIG